MNGPERRPAGEGMPETSPEAGASRTPSGWSRDAALASILGIEPYDPSLDGRDEEEEGEESRREAEDPLGRQPADLESGRRCPRARVHRGHAGLEARCGAASRRAHRAYRAERPQGREVEQALPRHRGPGLVPRFPLLHEVRQGDLPPRAGGRAPPTWNSPRPSTQRLPEPSRWSACNLADPVTRTPSILSGRPEASHFGLPWTPGRNISGLPLKGAKKVIGDARKKCPR